MTEKNISSISNNAAKPGTPMNTEPQDDTRSSCDSTTVPANDLYQCVIEDYADTHSVRKTAANCHTSMVTAQRILITAGLWSSRSSRQVKELLEQGKSAEQIAGELHLTKDAVYACMPYSRGLYGMQQTEDAKYSKEYRKRMETAEIGMHRGSEFATADSATSETFSELSSLAALRFDDATIKEYARLADEEEDIAADNSNYEALYALHLSLVDSCHRDEENMGLEPEEKGELLRLAKADHAISRDIIVSGKMSLHALHYAIQQLFGWQNSHLHNFYLSEEDFERLTAGRLGGYTDLCGILFRFPDGDMSDTCWDDDYKKGVSVKTWLRKKYTHSNLQLSVGDSWLGNLWGIEKFRERYPDFTDDTRLKDIDAKVFLEQSFNYLTERLEVGELFRLHASPGEAKDVRAWKGRQLGKVQLLKEDIDSENGFYDIEKLKNAAAQLRGWRQSRSQLEEMSWLRSDSFRKQVEREYGMSLDAVLQMHDEQIEIWLDECMDMMWLLNIDVSPFFDSIYYRYDYGDDWCVKIDVKEVYRRKEDAGYVDSAGQGVAAGLDDVLQKVDAKGKPECVAADGLNLVDDCGGIYGYLNMLRTINGKDREEAAGMRQWARGLGWTGRKSRAENML